MSKKPLPEQYRDSVNDVTLHVHNVLSQGQSLAPTAYLIKDDDDNMEVIVSSFDTEAKKDFFGELVRQHARRFGADALCFVCEAWTVPEKYRNTADIERIQRQYGDVANFPGRVPVVMFNFQSHAGAWLGIGSLNDSVSPKKMAALEWTEADAMRGRFSNLLPVKYGSAAQVAAFMAKARSQMYAAGIDPDVVYGKLSLATMLQEHAASSPVHLLTGQVIDRLIGMYTTMFGFDDDNNDDQHPGSPNA